MLLLVLVLSKPFLKAGEWEDSVFHFLNFKDFLKIESLNINSFATPVMMNISELRRAYKTSFRKMLSIPVNFLILSHQILILFCMWVLGLLTLQIPSLNTIFKIATIRP